MRGLSCSLLLVGLLAPMAVGTTSSPMAAEPGQAAYPIAGSAPHQRPLGAPTTKEMAKGADWYANALSGLSPPYPQSFVFLEAQGAWYTPFTRPGMRGPYDLRGWHGE